MDEGGRSWPRLSPFPDLQKLDGWAGLKEVEDSKILTANGDPGERYDCQAAHRLAQEAGGLEDAEPQHIFPLGAGRLVRRARNDAVVVDLARTVDIGLNDHGHGKRTDLVIARARGQIKQPRRRGHAQRLV